MTGLKLLIRRLKKNRHYREAYLLMYGDDTMDEVAAGSLGLALLGQWKGVRAVGLHPESRTTGEPWAVTARLY